MSPQQSKWYDESQWAEFKAQLLVCREFLLEAGNPPDVKDTLEPVKWTHEDFLYHPRWNIKDEEVIDETHPLWVDHMIMILVCTIYV
jgi:hypothetical protein